MSKQQKKSSNPLQIRKDAIALTRVIFLSTLRDKMGFSNDDLSTFWGHVEKLSDEIVEGRVSVSDLRRVLLEEAGIKL